MNLRQVFLAAFVICCLLFEAFALAAFYQTFDLEQDGKTPLLSGNLYTWKNLGFTYYVCNQSSETLNITVRTTETASQRRDKYGENQTIFEVFENVNKALDNDTILRIEYQHSDIDPNTSSIHFFLWARNRTHQFRISYVIGYIEQYILKSGIYFIFKSINMNSSTIYVRPWKTVTNLNLTRDPLQMIKVGVRLIDYSWEEPTPLSMSVAVDLTKSYIVTYYDKALPSMLHDYQIRLIQSSVIICAMFLPALQLAILLQKRLQS